MSTAPPRPPDGLHRVQPVGWAVLDGAHRCVIRSGVVTTARRWSGAPGTVHGRRGARPRCRSGSAGTDCPAARRRFPAGWGVRRNAPATARRPAWGELTRAAREAGGRRVVGLCGVRGARCRAGKEKGPDRPGAGSGPRPGRRGVPGGAVKVWGGKGGRLTAEGSAGLQPNDLPHRHRSGPGTQSLPAPHRYMNGQPNRNVPTRRRYAAIPVRR